MQSERSVLPALAGLRLLSVSEATGVYHQPITLPTGGTAAQRLLLVG